MKSNKKLKVKLKDILKIVDNDTDSPKIEKKENIHIQKALMEKNISIMEKINHNVTASVDPLSKGKMKNKVYDIYSPIKSSVDPQKK